MALLKRLILAALILVVLVYGVMFALNNSETVVLDLWLIKLPPIWVSFLIIGSFVIGGVLGVFISLFSILKSDTQKRMLKRKINKIEKNLQGSKELASGT
ncbi:MAG: hypothetical protein CSA52_00520 [Gammaproteobacteria bacterium]|nr:MAG: hypothetical protein CSB48_12530 [Pseudomonadota bacterium]PIE38962.1 MAG: hypothetical protein CSA52_00520 [Gammaproteobacteria bacterium]